MLACCVRQMELHDVHLSTIKHNFALPGHGVGFPFPMQMEGLMFKR